MRKKTHWQPQSGQTSIAHASLATRAGAGGVVRIVGGSFKRTPIKVADFVGLRPTPERVRETLFDWISHFLGGCEARRFCDMFAGSGALGVEAASRGAGRVLSFEINRKAAQSIASLVEKLGAKDVMEVRCADAMTALARTSEEFDVIFIDPPYASGLQGKALELASRILADRGLVYVESDVALEKHDISEKIWVVLRRGQAGQVKYYLLARNSEVGIVTSMGFSESA